MLLRGSFLAGRISVPRRAVVWILTGLLLPTAALAQPSETLAPETLSPVSPSSSPSGADTPPSVVLKERPAPGPSVPAAERARFASALKGSLIGTAIGGGLGALVLVVASEESNWENQSCSRGENEQCAGQRIAAFLVGTAFVLGGAPVGAVQTVPSNHSDTYVAAFMGQLMAGGLGYLLGAQLLGTRNPVVGGLLLGAPMGALGAAGGAVLAGDRTAASRSLIQARSGRWRLGLPTVQVHPPLGARRAPQVHASLLTMRW